MGQASSEPRAPLSRQGYHPLRRPSLRCLSAEVELFQKALHFLARTLYPLEVKSSELLLENERYYQQRTAVVHPHLLALSSFDFVEGATGGSLKGSLGSLGRWAEEGGKKTNVNSLCSLSIFDQNCRRVGGECPTVKLHLYHEYQGHTLESEIEMRRQCEVRFQEGELWTLLVAAASAAKALAQAGLKEPLLSPNAIKIDANGSFKVGEWEFSHFYEEVAEDEEETNFFQEGETFLRPASSRVKERPSGSKKSYNILTNYYWAPEGTAGLQNIVTLGRKSHPPDARARPSNHNQIFSLGMTILHICLMRPLYQSETFSEKKIASYVKEATALRAAQGIPLSSALISLLGRMLAWDAEERIGYCELWQEAAVHNPHSPLTSESETPMESGTFREKPRETNSLLVLEGKGSGSVLQGSGDMEHPLEQSQKLNLPCTIREEYSLNYEKIDFTIRRERREWERFENRIEEDSYKVRPNNNARQLFPSVSTFSFPAETLLQDGEDSVSSQALSGGGLGLTAERQRVDVEEGSGELNCTHEQSSIKLLDISNIKLQDETKELSKQRNSHLRPLNDSLSNIFAEHRNATEVSKEDSLLLKSSVTPHQPVNNDKEESLFTPPELLALIRSSAYSGRSRRTDKSNIQAPLQSIQPSRTVPPILEAPLVASEVVSEGIQAQLSSSIFVKQSFAKGYYEGGKVDGLRSGYGTFYYREGGKYCGDWDNNQMHGKGTLYYADGRIAYQGDWSRDALKGKGILYNEKPTKLDRPYDYRSFDQSEDCWVYYEGNFHEDDKWGRGVLQLSNGERFEGSFKNDLIDGRGVFYTMHGRRVIGEWEANQLVRVIKEEQVGQ